MHESEARPRWVVPMIPRSPDEAHRVSTPLELLFDLVIVVAVAQAAAALHHGIAEGHIAESVLSYVMVFIAIWWAWMGFTWFASSYDTDDIPYRLVVFAQMTGALILAAGIEPMFRDQNLTIPVFGYIVMRIAGVTNWLRAARSDPSHRPAALRTVIGTILVQLAWVLLLFVPSHLHIPGFFLLILVELLIPIWAEIGSPTSWHPHHIQERYSLFTLIVLGEAIFSTSVAIQSIFAGEINLNLIGIMFGALLIVYALWWLYFYQHARHDLMSSLRAAFIWAYGHLFIFAATAAVGAGLAIVIDYAAHHAEISAVAAGMVVAIPAAIYVFILWILQEHIRAKTVFDTLLNPVAAILILLTPFTGQAVLFTGILLSVLVVIRLVRHLE